MSNSKEINFISKGQFIIDAQNSFEFEGETDS
jgi:hypothetical protein